MNKNQLYKINTFMRIAVDESVVDRMYDITRDSVRGMARGYSQSVFYDVGTDFQDTRAPIMNTIRKLVDEMKND